MKKVLLLLCVLPLALDAMSPPKIFGRSKNKKNKKRKEEEQKNLDLVTRIANKSPQQREKEQARRINSFIGLNNIEQLQKFAENKTNFNVVSGSGQLPLCFAVLKANPDYVKLLIEGGASVNKQNGPNETNYPGQTPLHILMQLMGICHWEEIKKLLHSAQEKIDPNIPAKNGKISLHFAVSAIDESDAIENPIYRKNCIEGISFLLSLGADATTKDNAGRQAMETTDIKLIKIFKQHGKVTRSMQAILDKEEGKESEKIDQELRNLERRRRQLEYVREQAE